MTQEDKQLLFKDLCGRLPYHPFVHGKTGYAQNEGRLALVTSSGCAIITAGGSFFHYFFDEVKPYLRPMSSMTEEEMKTYRASQDTSCSYHYEFGDIVDDILYFDNDVSLDYLNSIHIDYRGLIPIGLALEATKDMYKIK